MNMGRQMQFKSTDKREFETRRKKHLESVGGSVSPDRHNSQNESPQQLLSTQEVQIRNLLVDNKDDAKWARAKRLGKIIRGEDSAINLYSPGSSVKASKRSLHKSDKNMQSVDSIVSDRRQDRPVIIKKPQNIHSLFDLSRDNSVQKFKQSVVLPTNEQSLDQSEMAKIQKN